MDEPQFTVRIRDEDPIREHMANLERYLGVSPQATEQLFVILSKWRPLAIKAVQC